MKANGIIIYAITFGSTPNATAKALLGRCATRQDLYYHAPNNAALRTIFKQVGRQLSNLRIAE